MRSEGADMMALGVLVGRQFRGRVRRWLRMVKQPKYFIGMAVGLLYYFWIFIGRTMNTPQGGRIPLADWSPESIVLLRLALGAVVGAFLTLGLALPGGPALPFEEAEIHHLFTAPLRRRSLLRYAILRAFPAIIAGSLLSVIFFGSGPILSRLARWPAAFALLACWLLWSKAITTWKARQKELPVARARLNRILAASLVVVFWTTVIVAAWPLVTSISASMESGMAWRTAAGEVSERAWALEILLAPLATPLRLLLATGWVDRAIGAAAVVVLLVVLEEWCVRAAVQFEDATIERARVVADVRQRGVAAFRRQVKPEQRKLVPFTLAPTGRPELAIAWKNLMAVSRLPERKSIARGIAVVAGLTVALAIGCSVPATRGISAGIAMMLFIGGCVVMAWIPLLSGSLWRNDMRSDLLHVDQLRTWPISPWRLVLAEVAGPAWQATLVGMFGAGLVLAGVGASLTGAQWDQAWVRSGHPLNAASEALGVSPVLLLVAFPFAALPVIASVALLSVSVQNLAVLLFPAWIRLGRDRARDQGAAAAGQRMLALFALAAVMGIALLPGAALIALIAVAQRAAHVPFMAFELPFLALVLATPLVAASAALTWFGARAWERLDPSAEMLSASVS